jgi:hypothetical protein
MTVWRGGFTRSLERRERAPRKSSTSPFVGDFTGRRRLAGSFKVIPKTCGFRSGVDVLRLNQLNDELEGEGFQRKLARSGRG